MCNDCSNAFLDPFDLCWLLKQSVLYLVNAIILRIGELVCVLKGYYFINKLTFCANFQLILLGFCLEMQTDEID